jgi:hypothetical protein
MNAVMKIDKKYIIDGVNTRIGVRKKYPKSILGDL